MIDMPQYSAKLHLLTTHGAGSGVIAPCSVDFCNGRELRITTPEPLAPGAAVSVEHEDALLLGEVVRSTGQSGGWQHFIRVEQILNGLMTIMALRAHLLQEAPRLFHVAKQ